MPHKIDFGHSFIHIDGRSKLLSDDSSAVCRNCFIMVFCRGEIDGCTLGYSDGRSQGRSDGWVLVAEMFTVVLTVQGRVESTGLFILSTVCKLPRFQ